MEIIGYISQSVIETLNLTLKPNTPDKYYKDISMIINSPDYVGINPRDGSILFVKLYKINEEYVRVAVKITSGNRCFAKTLHSLSTCNAERYIEKGTLKKLDTN